MTKLAFMFVIIGLYIWMSMFNQRLSKLERLVDELARVVTRKDTLKAGSP